MQARCGVALRVTSVHFTSLHFTSPGACGDAPAALALSLRFSDGQRVVVARIVGQRDAPISLHRARTRHSASSPDHRAWIAATSACFATM
ncbi:hypothetical protein BN2475_50210 [Paraburkholderia ribeironis]|uniref:Uncharacterized protein n=1 Tax=Paraburkholderia ribeironis TaxID=1247936 RepID=A0A1N7RL34_9BURK|nr:hypothetical protein BN2475_50210 [Paraburkholderia ribeironis]